MNASDERTTRHEYDTNTPNGLGSDLTVMRSLENVEIKMSSEQPNTIFVSGKSELPTLQQKYLVSIAFISTQLHTQFQPLKLWDRTIQYICIEELVLLHSLTERSHTKHHVS
uniref:Uncharacterized protein n=1 Tax=Cacopsylla melanoneura TaxID=428564 RepID=A0A8D8W902_9HEMI